MHVTDFPLLVLLVSLVALFLATELGDLLRSRVHPLTEEERADFAVVLGATLTLLGLLIGFSFSMAVGSYNQRKNNEEIEASVINTEFMRADLLPPNDGARVRDLLKQYIGVRILFYETGGRHDVAKVNADTAALQAQLWSTVRSAVTANPNPVTALVISGMSDVANAEGNTRAAWLNRIPFSAWVLMFLIAICSNLLIGYGAHHTSLRIFLIAPVTLSIAFFLISDLDSTVAGTINIIPQNLTSLSRSLP